MSDKWSGLRGIEVFSLALESVNVLDGAMIRALQRDSVLKDPVMAGAHITGATADAIGAAAKNSGGRSAFLYGTAGGAALFGGWRCSCGAQNSGKFCTECGTKKPAEEQKRRCTHCGWSPECGQPSPKFCPECGKPFC